MRLIQECIECGKEIDLMDSRNFYSDGNPVEFCSPECREKSDKKWGIAHNHATQELGSEGEGKKGHISGK